MRSGGLLRWLAVLSLSNGALSLPPRTGGKMPCTADIGSSQQHVSNTTTPASSASSTQPPTTPRPVPSTLLSSSGLSTIGTSSSAPATSTISNGNGTPVVAVIGVTYVAGAAGASLSIEGVVHNLAAGTVVSIVDSGANGDTPEIQTVSDPTASQHPRTTDPASASGPATSAPSTPSSTPASPTSSFPTSSSFTSSASSTATPAPYIVLAAQNATQADIQNINSTLARDAVPDSLTEVTSDRTGLAVFFKANLTSQQADALAPLPGVGSVAPDEALEEEQPPSSAPASTTSHQASATGPAGSPQTTVPNPADINLQSGALDELKVISQPPGASVADLPGFGYAFEAGKGVTIYVIDTGANVENTEWTGMPGTKGFMYAPGATKTETDFLNHGSCVASKSAGPAYGTAKDANLIMVKLPGDLSLSSIFTALVDVSNDVYKKGIDGKAVINMSLGSRIPNSHKLTSTVTAYKLLLAALMAEDIIIVTASGNDYQYGVDDVTEYPALFGPTTDIIVVGAVNDDGSRASYSQGSGSQLTVSAPGFVKCASGKTAGSQDLYGTSFAAPAVAGVIAVWLSQEEHRARLQVPGKVAANVKAMLQSLAYSRIEGEPAMIWNGVDPRGLACSSSSSGGGSRRRQAAGSVCSATSSAVPSAAPSSASAAPPSATSAPAATTTAAPSTTASASATALPKPQWDANPSGFTRVYEADGVASFDYVASSDSASEGVTDNIQQWCLDKCTDQCASVFLYRILTPNNTSYKSYYICNRYNTAWSEDYVQTGSSDGDSGVAFNKV